MITCVYECYAINCRCVSFYYLAHCLGRDLLSFSTLLSMIFIAPQGINCGSHSPQRFYSERLYKGAAPPTFNRTLERVALKVEEPPLCKQHSSKPPFTLN